MQIAIAQVPLFPQEQIAEKTSQKNWAIVDMCRTTCASNCRWSNLYLFASGTTSTSVRSTGVTSVIPKTLRVILGLVSPALEGAYGLRLCRIRLPGHPVHSCGSLAFIGCHALHRHYLGGSACDEKMLQGFRLVVLLLSLCLCDSPLQLAYPLPRTVEFVPRPCPRLG